MRFILSLIFILFLFQASLFSFGKNSLDLNTLKIAQTNDSIQKALAGKSYTELTEKYNQKRHIDTSIARHIAHSYLRKAKNDQDTIELANGYYMFLRLSWDHSPTALKYCDTIINLTKDVKDQYYPARGYIGKGLVFLDQKQYSKALEYYLVALEYAESNQNIDHIIACKHNIAELKNTLGKNREALGTFQKNLEIIRTKDTINQFLDYYIITYFNLGDSYNRLSVLDSAKFYFEKGINKSLTSDNQIMYADLLSGYGTNSYLRKEYTIAIDSLSKASTLLNKSQNNTNYYINQLFLAKTYLALKQPEKAFTHLKKIDGEINESNYTNSLRDTYTMLIDHYKSNDDQTNQLEIMEKLIKYDSISQEKERTLNASIIKNYDTAQLIKDKDELILGIQERSKTLQYRLLIAAILLISLVSFAYFYYFKREKKVYEQKFEEKYTDLLSKATKRKSSKQIEIAPEIVENIIYRLQKFEEEQEFLKNDLTMAKVAKKFKTNSSYLSKVINSHKKQNFANYVNDLRIEFCIEKLKTDSKFRRYSIKSIAQEIGFNNIQSFSSAFQKRMDQNPSDYIQNIDNQ